MPLLSAAKLAPNFTAHELGADLPEATAAVISNLREVAAWLQTVRGVLGVPLVVTSGFRPPRINAAVGGSDSSGHLEGCAADFVASRMTGFEAYHALIVAQNSRALPAFDQIIFYALDNHVHVGLGAQMRGQILLKTSEGSYVQLAGAYVSKIAGYL